LWDWAPDAATRQRILCDNPGVVYGFDSAIQEASQRPPLPRAANQRKT
jgi:hypothetical protein